MNFKYYKTSSLIIFILVLSIIFNAITNYFLGFLKDNEIAIKIIDYVGVLSVVSLITLTLFWINEFGWKWGIFKWLIDLPNLNGRYQGKLISTYKDSNDNYVEKKCVIEIKQTSSYIKIRSYFGNSDSPQVTSSGFSFSEHISKLENGCCEIYYIFGSEPDIFEKELNKHFGTTKFTFYPDKKVLKGEYYNERGNKGNINAVFEGKKILGRLTP